MSLHIDVHQIYKYMENLKMKYLKAAAFVAACCSISVAHAAEVGSGTLTLAESSFTFEGGPIVGTNATDAAGVQCIDPLLPCDTFALTVDLPDDVAEFFPTALIRVLLGPTDSPTGLDDYDLELLDSNGEIIAESSSDGAVEGVSIIALGGMSSYTVNIKHWLVVGGSYSATIELSLGIPSEDKTDEDVAMWLDEHGGSSMLLARSRASRSAATTGGGAAGWLSLILLGMLGLRRRHQK